MKRSARPMAPGVRLRTARPAIPPGYLRLARVNGALNTCAPGQVAVVVAGPGYGKTLGVSAWCESGSAGSVAWLIADAADTVAAFWSAVLVAMTAADAVAEDGALGEIVPGTRFGAPEVDLIIDIIAEQSSPVTLVIDEVHRIEDPAILDSLHRLIDRRPAALRLILIGRSMARLRLERIRLAGDLVELTATTLALTRREVAEFCANADVEISAAELDLIVERTEGWPAGIRLALLSSRDGDIHDGLSRFGGSNELVAAYLLEELLEHLPPSDRRFLLSTSVVSVICPDLARSLTGRSDSRAVLDALVAHNALTVRLTDRPDWYAYHPLLRELLADRLAAETPDAPDDLHRRAGRWCAEHADWVSAIRHYSAGRDWSAVADIVAGPALPLVLSPHEAELANALEPAEAEAAIRPTPETLFAATIGAYLRGDDAAMARNADDTVRAWECRSDDPPAAVRVVLALVRMVQARIHHVDHVLDRCDDILELVESFPREEIPAATAYSLIVGNNRAIGLLHRGDIQLAARELATSKATADACGMDLMSMASDCYLALVELIEGELPRVAERTAEIHRLAGRRGWTRQPQLLALHAANAWRHLEWGDLDAAERDIARGREMNVGVVDGGAAVLVAIAALRLAVFRGDTYAARIESERLAAVADDAGPLPELLYTWQQVVTARARILFGEKETAMLDLRDLLADADPWSYQGALLRVAVATVQLAHHRPGTAVDTLGPVDTYAPHRLQAVEAAILSAVASTQLNREAAAQEFIGDAIRLAAPIGLVRPFTVADPVVTRLVARHEHLVDRDRAFVKQLMAQQSGREPSSSLDVAIDPLTDRELVVLGYLPTMYKAAEIAADLFVSVNTVKTHQQAIYRKLGVSTRREAVDRARECNLL